MTHDKRKYLLENVCRWLQPLSGSVWMRNSQFILYYKMAGSTQTGASRRRYPGNYNFPGWCTRRSEDPNIQVPGMRQLSPQYMADRCSPPHPNDNFNQTKFLRCHAMASFWGDRSMAPYPRFRRLAIVRQVGHMSLHICGPACH